MWGNVPQGHLKDQRRLPGPYLRDKQQMLVYSKRDFAYRQTRRCYQPLRMVFSPTQLCPRIPNGLKYEAPRWYMKFSDENLALPHRKSPRTNLEGTRTPGALLVPLHLPVLGKVTSIKYSHIYKSFYCMFSIYDKIKSLQILFFLISVVQNSVDKHNSS